ncbi:MAG: rhodanese-like domain-containing protein [Chloroflexota bacterium]|nr:rhodanese-like domain-containing protein [Chloroflexota bacterium]
MYPYLNRLPDVPETTVDEVASRLEDDPEPLFLLDVREQEEWDDAHIEQAILMSLGQLQGHITEIPTDREIICICRSGQRSAVATQALERAGYNAKNMKGGMLEWVRRGHPITR